MYSFGQELIQSKKIEAAIQTEAEVRKYLEEAGVLSGAADASDY